MERRGWKLVVLVLVATSGGCLKNVFGGKSSGRPEAQQAPVARSPAPAAQTPDELCPKQGATGMDTCS